jgi:hypothetical protein
VAGPYVIALSVARGRLLLGDAGILNYAWFVHPTRHVIPEEHWQGGPDPYGRPLHPTRRRWINPDVFEFAQPVPGVYPPWTDPSYWLEGLRWQFDVAAVVTAIGINLRLYADLIAVPLAALSSVMLVVGTHAGR